jgi:hypothetical protein
VLINPNKKKQQWVWKFLISVFARRKFARTPRRHSKRQRPVFATRCWGNVSPVTSSAWQMHFYSRSFSIRSNIIKESNVCSKVSRWHVRYHRHGIKRQLFSWMVHLIRITMVRFLFLSKRRRIQFIASLIIGLRKSMSMGENRLNSQGFMDLVSQQF